MTRYYTLVFLPNYVNGRLTQDCICVCFARVYNIMVCAVPCPSENSRIHTRPGMIALLANYSVEPLIRYPLR